MATTKTTETTKNTVRITLPRARAGEDPTYFVAINGVNYLIPKGKAVDVPPAVAAEINRAQAAEEYYHDDAERRQKETSK